MSPLAVSSIYIIAANHRRNFMPATAKKMRAVQISKLNGPFEIVERDIPEPGPHEVRVKVQACGICHSDSVVKTGQWPGLNYPRVPGHEVVGVIDALGSNIITWKAGERV